MTINDKFDPDFPSRYIDNNFDTLVAAQDLDNNNNGYWVLVKKQQELFQQKRKRYY